VLETRLGCGREGTHQSSLARSKLAAEAGACAARVVALAVAVEGSSPTVAEALARGAAVQVDRLTFA
jgi:hypothetical protein